MFYVTVAGLELGQGRGPNWGVEGGSRPSSYFSKLLTVEGTLGGISFSHLDYHLVPSLEHNFVIKAFTWQESDSSRKIELCVCLLQGRVKVYFGKLYKEREKRK